MPQPPSRHTVTFKIGDQPVPGYRLARELGRGTFGVVWLAVTENGFERALKVVNLEQKGGKKEFRALRLIKDRKILHGNLLTLIDYWLLDRDGTILSTPNNITLDSHIAPPKTGSAASPGTLVSSERTAQPQITKLGPGIQGTMMPGHDSTDEEKFSVRDTFQQFRNTDTTTEENSNAIWLVVAMELGHKTLHDRQKEHTQVLNSKTQTKVGRRNKTELDNNDGTAGSNTVADRKSAQQQNDDDDLAPLSAEEVLPYMEQAARGLDYLHRCEIVHRDIKPQNIMLVGDVAKVCDYGLASELGDIRATTNAFTLPYAAPEAINKNQPTPASDQYSLAVTYVELRTGRWPFVSNTSTAVYAAKDTGHHHLKFVPNRNVRAVLKKALAKRPQDRFPTCGEFVKQLAKAEATKFNLFATLQAALAILAIATVLLAASATHPPIRKYFLSLIPPGWIPGRVETPQLNPVEFRRNLEFAEGLLKTDRAAALQSFESLQSTIAELPETEVELRDRAALGLARAKAGQAGYLVDAVQRDQVLDLVRKVSTPTSATIDGARGLQSHYLRFISDGEFAAVEGIGPEAELAQTSLLDWERELWYDAIKDRIPVSAKIRSALEKVIALRKDGSSGSLRESRKELNSLQEELKTATSVPEELHHRIVLEDLHLSLAEESLEPDDHLQALREFVGQASKVEPHLLERAHLLGFLLLGKKHNSSISYSDAETAAAVNSLKPELFVRTRLDGLHFSNSEANELVKLKEQVKTETKASSESLAARNFAPLLQLCTKREGYQLLTERLRKFVSPMAMPGVPYATIRLAADDLQAYLDREYPLSELTGIDQQTATRDRADLGLEVSFANPEADPEAVLKDFTNQAIASGDTTKWFQRLLTLAANPKWTKAAAVPLRHFITNPTPELAKHSQFGEWQRKFEATQLREVWLVDPSDPAAIQKILDTLKGNSGSALAVNAGPLPSLLAVECEILTTSAPTAEKLRDWDNRLEQALSAAESDPDLLAYGNFVRARRLALGQSDSDQEEATELVQATLSTTPLPAWLTKSRLHGVGDVLALAAIRSLNVKDAAVPRFAELSLPASPQLAVWQTAVGKAGLSIPALSAVAAISQATQGGQPNWAEIHRQAAAAVQDPKTMELFTRCGAARVLNYVSAWSALNATPANALPPPEVVHDFKTLLLAKENDKHIYFAYAGGQTTNDERLLQNLINPVLNRISNVADVGVKELPAKDLAYLFGAKGRLLQRNPFIIRVDPSKENDSRDSSVVAVVQANLAYDRARQLDDHVEYVVGYCRTLAILPEAPKTRSGTLKEISELIGKRTAEERETNLGLRYLVAYAKRLNAYPTDNIPEIDGAGKLYQALLDELPEADPLGLVPLCREGLSDIHLRLGYLHETVTAREVRQLLANVEPDPKTKAYHLRLAVSYGTAAVESSHLSQNENAYIAVANAYEDYAYYLGIPGAYEKSRKHFLSGISSAKDRGLPLAKARLNYGRCLFRHATDKMLELSSTERQTALEDAVEQLQVAIKAGTLRAEDEVEANLWLAETKIALGNRATDKAKFERFEEAMGAYQAATTAAQTNKLTKLQMVAISRESDARESLWRAYNKPDTKDIIRAPAHFNRAVELDALGYQLFAANPATMQPRYVSDLAANSVMTSAGDRKQQLRWIEGSPAIAKQWSANDEWRLAAVFLHLLLANQKDHEAAEVAAARKVQSTIADQTVQRKALVRILEFEATRKCAIFNDSIGKNPGIKPAQEAALAEEPLAAMMEAMKVRAELVGEPGPIDKSKDVKDLETSELVARINQMSASSFVKFARTLTPIQKKKLADNLLTAPNILFRVHVVKLCHAVINAADENPKLAALKTERTRLAHDSIKPLFVFSDDDLAALGLLTLKRNQQNNLDAFERDLKAAGVKFEAYAGP